MPRTVDIQKIFYGMNIHPQYRDAPWVTTPAEVIDELDELGCSVARIDCYGLESEANIILEHIREAEKKDMLVVPCFGYHTPFYHDDPVQNYDAGKYYGALTADLLKEHCQIYEVSNEICVHCNGEGAGKDPEAYDHVKYLDCRELIRGVIDGIKSIQPDAKIIIGGGVTTLTGFNRMLWHGIEPDGSTGHPVVRWDYTGWHWYESSGLITEAYDGTATPYNVIEELAKFGVPIWITELGFVPHGAEEQQSAYVETALAEYRGYRDLYNVVNVCWYALYDDGSGTFGLIGVGEDMSLVSSASGATQQNPRTYADDATRKVAELYARAKPADRSGASRAAAMTRPAVASTRTGVATGGEIDSLTRKPAHGAFKSFLAEDPDLGLPEGEFHTAEYTLPMMLYEKLKDAAAQNQHTENDELVIRLDSTFMSEWALYLKLTQAAAQNGVSFWDELVARIESTFS